MMEHKQGFEGELSAEPGQYATQAEAKAAESLHPHRMYLDFKTPDDQRAAQEFFEKSSAYAPGAYAKIQPDPNFGNHEAGSKHDTALEINIKQEIGSEANTKNRMSELLRIFSQQINPRTNKPFEFEILDDIHGLQPKRTSSIPPQTPSKNNLFEMPKRLETPQLPDEEHFDRAA